MHQMLHIISLSLKKQCEQNKLHPQTTPPNRHTFFVANIFVKSYPTRLSAQPASQLSLFCSLSYYFCFVAYRSHRKSIPIDHFRLILHSFNCTLFFTLVSNLELFVCRQIRSRRYVWVDNEGDKRQERERESLLTPTTWKISLTNLLSLETLKIFSSKQVAAYLFTCLFID